MKRCLECRRDYYDDTLSFCLADGTELVYGLSDDEPATAILPEPGALATGFRHGEDKTRPQINTTDQTAIFPRGAEAEPQKKLGDSSERHRFWHEKRASVAGTPQPSAHRAAKPLAVIGVAAVLLIAGFFGYRYFSPPSKQIESIAVMPFVNASGNADVEYLSDGMTETLISSLASVPNLSVKPRSTVFRYKGKETDAKTIGKELNVQAILNGRVVQRGDQLTLSLELIDVEKDIVLWSQQYVRKQSDLVSLQSEIARDVSGKLKSKLSGADTAKVEKNYTANPDAYQLYLKGRHYLLKTTRDGFQTSITYFQQAIAIDPSYALAYAGLADAYRSLSLAGELRPREFMPQAKAAGQKAVELLSLIHI